MLQCKISGDTVSPTIYDVVEAVAHNRNYIYDAFNDASAHELLQYRVLIVGHGRSGKDTVAALLAEKFGYRLGGSMSYAVIPLITYSLTGRTDAYMQEYCYKHRHNNRKYWYDYCNLLRQIDPLLLVKLTLSTTDFIIGIRDKDEFINSLDYFKPHNVLWIERKGTPVDPTMDYDRLFVSEQCNPRGIRHTTVGNNDSVDVLSVQLDNLINSGIIICGDYGSQEITDNVKRGSGVLV